MDGSLQHLFATHHGHPHAVQQAQQHIPYMPYSMSITVRDSLPEISAAQMSGYPSARYPPSGSSSYATSPHESRHPTPSLSGARAGLSSSASELDPYAPGPSSAGAQHHSQAGSIENGGATGSVGPTGEDGEEEPLYVNAKQYNRILKRRLARARLEELHRMSRQRKPYLHESRHKHAMRRPRGPGGRFLTAEERAAQEARTAGSGSQTTSPSDHHDDEPYSAATSTSFAIPEPRSA